MSAVARVATTVVLALVVMACGNTPTEITPLPRAAGEVRSVLLQVSQLRPVDAATEGTYFLWALLERNEAQGLGKFFVTDAGVVVNEAGVPIQEFTSPDFALRRTLALLITLELPGSEPDSPTGTQILSGTFIDGVAALTVPIPSAVQQAAGSVRVFTPTDGPGTNETSGLWMLDGAGDPSLSLPDTTAALTYEAFVDINGQSVSMGRFESATGADSGNRFSSTLVAAPDRPGEDFLMSAPEGLVFPTDLSGARVTISLEGRSLDLPGRGQLIVLDAVLPAGLVGNEQIPFINRVAETFPVGRAVLF